MRRSSICFILWFFWLFLAWAFHEMGFLVICMVWSAAGLTLRGVEAAASTLLGVHFTGTRREP